MWRRENPSCVCRALVLIGSELLITWSDASQNQGSLLRNPEDYGLQASVYLAFNGANRKQVPHDKNCIGTSCLPAEDPYTLDVLSTFFYSLKRVNVPAAQHLLKKIIRSWLPSSTL